MPETILSYLTALIYFTKICSCFAIAETLGKVSHDRLTRMLNGDWSGQRLLELALRAFFLVVGGYLIIDDTVIEKPYSSKLSECAWVYSSKRKKVVFGISVVLLVWTDGQIRIPLGYRVWKKEGPSKFELALELLSYGRNRLGVRPKFVLFDSWYPSKEILKRIKDYGWYFVCQVKKNRRFEGMALRDYKKQPYWQASGYLSGGIKVFVVRYRSKYYATNRLSLSGEQVRELYKIRHGVEEVIKALKDKLSLEGCQAGWELIESEAARKKEGAQEKHVALCLVAYLILERERIDRGVTFYKLKRHLISKGLYVSLPSLDRLRASA
jgi:hypothetical protein